MMMRLPKSARLIRFLTALIIAFQAGTAVADLASYPVVIQTPEGKQFYYLLELAATPAARHKGLMNRYDLGSGDGMLFVLAGRRSQKLLDEKHADQSGYSIFFF